MQSESELKSCGETFIPFVQERDNIGRMFSQTLVNNRMKSTIAHNRSNPAIEELIGK